MPEDTIAKFIAFGVPALIELAALILALTVGGLWAGIAAGQI